MIIRKEYIDYLIKFKDMELIKVVTGVRRCGKSTLFIQYIDYLKQNSINDDHIVFINMEDMKYEELSDYKNLYNYINEKIVDNGTPCSSRRTVMFILQAPMLICCLEN